MDLIAFNFYIYFYLKKKFAKLLNKKRLKIESFKIYLLIYLVFIYSSVSNLLRLGPATKPTSPNRTIEPIPTPAAQGLKPPIANEANKFINFKYIYLAVSIQNFCRRYTQIETFLRNSYVILY